jgi:hypothetical protein
VVIFGCFGGVLKNHGNLIASTVLAVKSEPLPLFTPKLSENT